MKLALFFLTILMLGSVTALSEKQICFQVYDFIQGHPGGYNVLDIQSLDSALNTSSGPYLDDFYGKCVSPGYITSFQEDQGSNPEECNLNISSFFSASINIPFDIYFGNLNCNSEKRLNYFFSLDSGGASGVRFWLIIPGILLIGLIVYVIKRKKKVKSS